MRNALMILVVTLFCSQGLYSQVSAIRGSITDTVNKKQLANSSVMLVRKSDSVLVTYKRAAADGSFNMNAAPGKYVLMISYPGFGDYSDSLTLTDQLYDFGNIYLTPKSKLLEEIIIKKTIPAIRMKGDTIVYKADSFRVQPGATVEDLLKTLPGFVVDKNGNITAQGERVKKILVDGEEFFSDDPTIATKNLQSAMVDELEVFDKKSDQAEFTGIDDGQKTKTVNLKLKEDKKNGYFGKLELGSDLNNYWSNSAMINYFKGKKKVAAHGLMASDGRTGLNFQEMMNYGGMGGAQTEMMDGGGISISIETPDDDFDWGTFQGEGLPKSWSAGGHFSNKWDKDRKNFNGTYRFKKLDNDANIVNRSQYITPDTTFFVNERNKTYSSKQSHSILGTYDVKLDSSSSIKVVVSGLKGNGRNFSALNTESINPEGDTINTGSRINTSLSENEAFNSSLMYRKKFKKAGHTFSATIRQNYSNNTSEGFLKAINTFYDSKGIMVRQDLIDQQKIKGNKRNYYQGMLNYTQPLSKKAFLEFNYQLSNQGLRSLKKTLEKSAPGDDKYEVIVPAFSNDYDFNTWENRGGMNFKFSKMKKYNFTVGAAASYTSLIQNDLIRDTTRKYNYLNFFPRVNGNFTLKGNRNLYFNYYGRTEQPSLNAIQPVADNTDPLNVSIGNPDLNLAIIHNFNLSFNRYDMLTESGYFMSYRFNISQHSFSTRNFIDSLGRRVYQTVNVDGVFNHSFYLDWNKKIKGTKFNFSTGPELSYRQDVNFVNTEKNIIKNGNLGGNVNLRYNVEKKYNFSIRASGSYNFSKSSIRSDIKTNYWLQDYSLNYGYFFLKKWELNGELNASLRQKTPAFPDDSNVLLWNMWLDRKFGKKDDVKLRLYAFDILNKNLGFRRTINSNLISERTYNTYNRYLMISFIWNFSKNGKPAGW
ncbi:MAG TPA: outer membrane beta-barrel protein [Chitinophagaceae bacterium]|nr:outer membrane beta-barrel protein [Chitinophagaceae bacterium]